MTRAALLAVIGVLLLGAAARAEIYIYHANDTGGIIPWSCENEAIAQQVAAAYCARWDKYHRKSPACTGSMVTHRGQLPMVALRKPLRAAGGTDPLHLLRHPPNPTSCQPWSAPPKADHL
jgi:hypothetical protein